MFSSAQALGYRDTKESGKFNQPTNKPQREFEKSMTLKTIKAVVLKNIIKKCSFYSTGLN